MRHQIPDYTNEGIKENSNEIPKPLPLKLRKNGFDYTQVLRSGKVYIYEQRVTENTLYYEVFLHRISLEKLIKGKKLPSKIKYPHDEAFGTWAWTYKDLDKAMRKFLEFHISIIKAN
jgi:hypothetical protein